MRATILALATFMICACGKVGFGHNSSSDDPGTVVKNGVNLPKLRFVGPPCVRLEPCLVEFNVVTAQTYTIEFDWQTDDELYKKTPPDGVTYGEPNVHYTPSTGHVVFAPGETKKQFYVQNINEDGEIELTIGVRMKNCIYDGGKLAACRDLFN